MQFNDQVGSKYRFILLAGQRVAQLQKGAKARVNPDGDHNKYTRIATKELSEEKLVFHKKAIEAAEAPAEG